ncbi:MAG: DUF4416 family protein [Candidatus Omnitrophica bacterium]|nr:DUF4416 family protein [Candidatus Omnitrophota bacterium]
MGVLMKQNPVKLIVSFIYKDKVKMSEVETRLKSVYGQLEDLKKQLMFDYTDYYRNEFGKPLKRKLICFKKLVRRDDIAKIKLFTNRIENRFCIEGKRTVNVDPGYVNDAKLVLLTTKDYTHRVYIGRQIFAESTLFFKDNSFNSWPWTYPDYARKEMISYFNEVRGLYMEDLAGKKG